MQRYLGIDVHQSSCSVCVMSAAGQRVREDVVETNGEALVGYVESLAGSVHACWEESEWAGWLWEVLEPHVAEAAVVRGIRRRGSKSDARDARALAERMRTGQIQDSIYKAPSRYAKLRDLAQVYQLLTRDVARAKNRLKSRFRRRGIACAGESIYRSSQRRRRLRELPASARRSVELLGEHLDQLEPLRAQARAAMVEESHRYEISHRLETIPGLAEVRVAQLLPIVVTPFRFRTKRQFWSYCGLGIRTHSSSDWVQVNGQWVRGYTVQTRGLNRDCNRILKSIFKGAATTVLQLSSPNPFRTAYDRLLAHGTKPNLAKVTVARKLAATTLAIWKSEEVYDPER